MENGHWKRKTLSELVGNILIIYQVFLSGYLASLGSVLTLFKNIPNKMG